MKKSGKFWIALLRAISPATHKKMSMQDLRSSCEKAGFKNVSTYIASGNLLFTSTLSKAKLNVVLRNILAEYGLDNKIVLRTPSELDKVRTIAPHATAAKNRPNHLLIVFFDNKLSTAAVTELAARAGPEKLLALDRELCVDYKDGVARSRLTPAVIDRVLGQSGTARNWNTVSKLIAHSEKLS